MNSLMIKSVIFLKKYNNITDRYSINEYRYSINEYAIQRGHFKPFV
jgi:hypothetical protein